MASPNAILEPQITLKSVEDDNVVLNASPEWKQKLADFLKYAATTYDAEVDCFVSSQGLDDVRKKILPQVNKLNQLRLSKPELLDISTALLALNVMPYEGFYEYPPDDFDRIHDDIFIIFETVFKKNQIWERRVKTGLSGDFDG